MSPRSEVIPPGEAVTFGVRVTADRRDVAAVYARKHRLEIGPSASFDPEEPRLTALEHLLGAVGADLATGLVRLARPRGVELDGVEVTVRGWLDNPLTFLHVVGEEGSPVLSRVQARVYLTTMAGDGAVSELWEEVLETSPLVGTLRRATELDLSVTTVM